MSERIEGRGRRWWSAAVLMHAAALAACAQEPQPETVVPTPRTAEGAWMRQHEAMVDRLQRGDVGLIFIGDSIIQGWNNEDGEGRGPQEVWDRYYAPRKAVNLGIGGDRTQHVLWRLDHGALRGIQPGVAVVMIGTNNLHSDAPAEIDRGIEAIVRRVRAGLPETHVLLLGIFPRGPEPDSVRQRLRAVNERITRLAEDPMVTYLDVGDAFLNEDGTISREIMPDFLHLSRKGYRLWADAMEPTLWSLLDEPKVRGMAPR